MIGRAKALKETSTELRGRLRYAVYDDAIRRQLFREKHLENIMGAALQNREFQVYLQPDRKRNHQRRRGAGPLDERRRHDLSRRVHLAVRKERVHHPAGPLGVRRGLPPHPGVARRRAAPGKSTGELLPRATQIPFSWSAISKSARGAARRRNTLKSSSRKTWCSRTWANSARSSKPSMRPVPVALWTTSGAAIPPST
jgi:hypothetical protein